MLRRQGLTHVASRERPPIGHAQASAPATIVPDKQAGFAMSGGGRGDHRRLWAVEAARLASREQFILQMPTGRSRGTTCIHQGERPHAGQEHSARRAAATFGSGDRQTGQCRLPRPSSQMTAGSAADAVRRHRLCLRCASPLPSHLPLNRSDQRSLDISLDLSAGVRREHASSRSREHPPTVLELYEQGNSVARADRRAALWRRGSSAFSTRRPLP